MTTLHQVRAAVIGYGGIGSAHTASIAQGKVKGMTLAAVCDINPARLDIVRERFPGVRCEADYHDLLDGSIDASALEALQMGDGQLRWSIQEEDVTLDFELSEGGGGE